MAIKITQGTTPQYGRMSMPQGTFLSNPSTAADGSLGAGGGTLPSQPSGWTGDLGYGTIQTPQYSEGQWYSPILNAFNSLNRNLTKADASFRTMQNPWGPIATSQFGPLAPVAQFGQNLNNIATQIGQGIGNGDKNYKSPFNPTVSTEFGTPQGLPSGAVPAAQANILGGSDGLTPAQVAKQMVDRGYMLTNQPGVGEVWVPTSRSAPKPGISSANNRQEWVDGASLAPGESAIDANGNRYVGGTPAPDGTPQYSVSYANPSAAKDTKGKYKWVSSVRKDANGNWVRVNKQVLRKVYTRSHLKAAAARQSEASQPTQQANTQEFNQLVNFRANYG